MSEFPFLRSGRRKHSSLWGICCFLLFLPACGPSEGPILESKEELVVQLPGIGEKGGSMPHHVTRRKGKEFLAYYDPRGPSIRRVPLDRSAPSPDPIPLDRIAGKDRLRYFPPEACLAAPDSLFVALDERKKLYLLDQEGRLLKEWELERPDGKGHRLHISSKHPFERCGSGLFLRSVPRCTPYGDTRSEYYSLPPELRLELGDSSLTPSLVGAWPDRYKERNYYDSYPHRELIERGGRVRSVYSFKAADSLYLFEGRQLRKKVEAKSRSIEAFETFQEDSLGNIAYTERYLTTAPHYGAIVWDPFRDLFYRQAFHPCSYKGPEGKRVKGASDQPWSLIVMDEDFEKLGEMKMDPKRYMPGPLLVSKSGLLVREKGGADEEQLRFSVLEPKKGL